jgi:hypothetical protein
VQNSYNLAGNYGPSDFDTRNRFVFSGLYSPSLGESQLMKGWQLGSITQIQSGNPLSVVTSSTLNGTSGTIRANVSGPVKPKLTYLASGAVQYLPASVCPTPTAGCVFSSNGTQFGTSSRNFVDGPGFEDVDFSLDKKTTFRERFTIDIKVDAFNVLNHPNFGQPINQFAVTPTTATAGSFGQISSTRFPSGDVGSSRQMQLSGKFIF